MIHQLNELIQMETPLGEGWAVILETTAHEYFWTVALENGALVTFTQDRVRVAESYTLGRGMTDGRMKEAIKR